MDYLSEIQQNLIGVTLTFGSVEHDFVCSENPSLVSTVSTFKFHPRRSLIHKSLYSLHANRTVDDTNQAKTSSASSLPAPSSPVHHNKPTTVYKYWLIKSLRLPIRAYTPGNAACAHPVPQLTVPINVPELVSTIGPPLSPWHESLPPALTAAQNIFVVTVLGGESFRYMAAHCERETTGTSTLRRLTGAVWLFWLV